MRKHRPVRADVQGRLRETRHGTRHYTTWRPVKPPVAARRRPARP